MFAVCVFISQAYVVVAWADAVIAVVEKTPESSSCRLGGVDKKYRYDTI